MEIIDINIETEHSADSDMHPPNTPQRDGSSSNRKKPIRYNENDTSNMRGSEDDNTFSLTCSLADMALNSSLRAEASSRSQLPSTIGSHQDPERLQVGKEWLVYYYEHLLIKTKKVDNEYIATLMFFDVINYNKNAFLNFLIQTESPNVKRDIIEYALELFSEVLGSRSKNGVHIDYSYLLVQYQGAVELVYDDAESAINFIEAHAFDDASEMLVKGPQNESDWRDWCMVGPALEFFAVTDVWVGVEGKMAAAVGMMLEAILEKAAGMERRRCVLHK